MTEHRPQVPLTTDIAQRMYRTAQDFPGETKADTRARYEAMAAEARRVMSERLTLYSDSIAELCLQKRHVGSSPTGNTAGDQGTPCPQCRMQIRNMRTALKVITPATGE